jgi:hypothetical protein
MLDITDQVLKSFEKLNKKREEKIKKRSPGVTLKRIAETFNLRTLYLIIRRAELNSDRNEFVTEPEIRFCSNGFTGGMQQINTKYILF